LTTEGGLVSEGGDARFGDVWALRPRVEAYVRSRRVDRWTVDDVVAETYVVAWRRLGEVPGEDEAAFRWLVGVARRALADERRSLRRSSALVDRLASHGGLVGAAAAGVSERCLSVEAWWALGEQDRLVLELMAWHAVSPAELAGVLGCSVGAARSRLWRARARLAALFF
jgi:RNA polymerase sigma factor (sigma-70 family)